MRLANPPRIVIPGGTGQLGMLLGRHFYDQGYTVASISRFPKPHPWEAVHWDAESVGDWASSLEGAAAVINLAGRSIRCRYTSANKKSIYHSRIRTTEILAQAISQCANPPRVWLNASSANIYPHAVDRDMDETSPLAGNAVPPRWRFAAEMAQAWERAVYSSPTPHTRKIILRMAPVMNPENGWAFERLLRLVRWGFGGEMGDGEQYVSWIHDFDFVRAFDFLVQRDDIDGIVNLAAPNPLPNHEFMCNLRRSWCTSYFGLPLPGWLVEAVAFAIRLEPELVLKSRRVVPERLLQAGFSFHFPKWRSASENLVERWRNIEPARVTSFP